MNKLRYFSISAEHLSADHFCYKQLQSDGFHPHTHDMWELIFVKSGSVSYLSEGKCYCVKDGDCILTPPGVRHTLQFCKKDIYDRYTILFCPTKTTLPANIPELIHADSSPIIKELFHKMDFYCEYLDAASFENIVQNLTEEALVNFRIAADGVQENYTANTIVTQAIFYINTHLDMQISLNDLCDYLHVTKSYLHRLFSEHLQITPAKYIAVKQLNKARMQIRAGGKPAKVYNQCGFQDYCTFYRNYIRHFGYPPSEELGRPSSQIIEW